MRLRRPKFYDEFVTVPAPDRVSRAAAARALHQQAPPAIGAEALERLVCAGHSAEVLREAPAPTALAPEIAFALGRAAEDEEDFVLARQLFERAEKSLRMDFAQRASAHLAYLAYFDGNFEAGLQRAKSLTRAADLVTRAEAVLYRSVNAMALNRSREALDAALSATRMTARVRLAWLRTDLRFRSSRQLVHVLIARGDYGEASAEADRATALARRQGTNRNLGLASYLRALVRFSRGDRSCLALFAEADRQWGGPHHSFGRWLRYLWAAALRDHGDPHAARVLRLTTPVRLAWEESLFDLAAGRISLPDLSGRPADELPFLNATAGLVLYVAGDLAAARTALALAMQEFERSELEHYRRGVALTLAAVATQEDEREAIARIHAELPGLTLNRLRRWPWWHLPTANRLAKFCLSKGIAVAYWRELAGSPRANEELDDTMRGRGLTEREIEVVSTWAAHPELTRSELAGRLRVTEATVRNLLNRARRKLGISAPRGSSALRARLEQLAPVRLSR